MIPNKSQAVPAVESGKIRNSTQQYAFMSDGYHEYRDIDGYRTYMNLLAIGDYSNIFSGISSGHDGDFWNEQFRVCLQMGGENPPDLCVDQWIE